MLANERASSDIGERKRVALMKEFQENFKPKFEVGTYVRIKNTERDVTYEGIPKDPQECGLILEILAPGKGENPLRQGDDKVKNKYMYYVELCDEEDNEIGEDYFFYEHQLEVWQAAPISDKPDCYYRRFENSRKQLSFMGIENDGGEALHPLNLIGVDTCSALSVSTERDDFWFVDESPEAKQSVAIRGVGGADSKIIGRGPLVVHTVDKKGKKIAMIDPAGVYLLGTRTQARLRILGQQRMKNFGFHLVQKAGESCDFLEYGNQTKIPLLTHSGILMMKTVRPNLSQEMFSQLDLYVNEILKGKVHLNALKLNENRIFQPVLFNREKNKIEENRLRHWRHAHRDIPGSRFEENCPTCNKAKMKVKSFKRNATFHGTTENTKIPFFRLYQDMYGGQESMGELSYQAAKGGVVFVCPVSGTIITKLYGTSEQYPAILYQVLQDIESKGYSCREIYSDTYVVNFSRAAEDVASMFKTKLVPVSAGTPQEMAYAERAVGNLAQMSRAQMLGAPHLPAFCWGLSDLYAAYVHSTIPQLKLQWKSPYEVITKRKPDDELLFIKVFGCPCQYAPMDGAEHKRAAKCLWGWFVGVQFPAVYILRPEDNKIISVSRKKVTCHEQMYATFDPLIHSKPQINFVDFALDENEVNEAITRAKMVVDKEIESNIPDHVMSIKSLSDYKRNSNFNLAEPKNMPEKFVRIFNSPDDRGEKTELQKPEFFKNKFDHLLEEIKRFKKTVSEHDEEDSRTEKIIQALKKAENEINNKGPKKGGLLKANKKVRGVDIANILNSKRRRTVTVETPNGRVTLKAPKKKNIKSKRQSGNNDIQPLDNVKIKTSRFGKSYAKGKPFWTYGSVLEVKNGIAKVWYDNSDGGETMDSHVSHLEKFDMPILMSKEEWDRNDGDRKILEFKERDGKKIETLLPVLEVGASISKENDDFGGTTPKDFYEAMVRPDWRKWVEAVKNENESWNLFEASEEIAYDDMERGASIIPLGELFTVKRSGKYKFRQYAMGNLLKEGKDYGETFSTTVSGDGLRWFCSLAVTCGCEIRGWDATTGYLQTKQRIPIYAFLPSHQGYSSLSYEDLGKFRVQLVSLLKKEGIKGLRNFSKTMRQERRFKPKTVLKLKRSVYGIPDAGQSFSMFMQSLHLKKCGLVQSEMDPCVFYKIVQNEKGGPVSAFLVVITWVDDCRYFGTKELVDEYEETITKNCKCTMEGVCKEFVSIEIHHDLEAKTLELKQSTYWEKAMIRFKEFLKDGEAQIRRVPLSPADDKLLVEPSSAEIEEAKHLPYRSVLGVVQYPSAYTRLDMKYAMSTLSRFRTRWGPNHFKILLKALEYGYSTRNIGILYNGRGTAEEKNVLVGFADANLSVPRSRGCRFIWMNGGPISFSSKLHTTPDDSTTSAELTEQHLLAYDIEGFRTLMDEIGLKQIGPTVMFQDNRAAIQISMNRGSLSKKTRAMDLKTLSVRSKVEDMKVVPIYIETTKMVADIGTKALEPKQFELLRDMLCGYAVMKVIHEGKEDEYMAAIRKEVKRNIFNKADGEAKDQKM